MTPDLFTLFSDYLSGSHTVPSRSDDLANARRAIKRGEPLFDFVTWLVKSGQVDLLERVYSGSTRLHAIIGDEIRSTDAPAQGNNSAVRAIRALAGLGLALTGEMPPEGPLHGALAWYTEALGSLPVHSEWDPLTGDEGREQLRPLMKPLADAASDENSAGPALTTALALFELAAGAGVAPEIRRKRQASVTVLLVRNDKGIRARLQMSAIRGLPPGLVPDPRRMVLFSADEGFQRSLFKAWSLAGAAHANGTVLWSIAEGAENPSPRIRGESAGAALAVTLDEIRRLSSPLPGLRFARRLRASTAIVGKLDTSGNLKGVTGYSGKLAALSEDSRVIIPRDDIKIAGSVGLRGMEIVPAANWKEAASKARRPNGKVILRQALAVFAVLAIVAGLVAWRQASDANAQRVQSLAAAMDLDSGNMAESNPALSSLLSVAAWRLHRSPGTWYAMLAAAARPETGTFTIPGNITVDSAKFSPDDKTLAAIRANGTVQAWDIATGQLLSTVGTPGSDALFSVAFSPDDKTLATGSGDGGTVRLWETATGRLINSFTIPGGSDAGPLAFSPDGKTLATGSYTDPVELWNTATGHPVSSFTIPGSNGADPLAFSPDGKTLVIDIGGRDNSAVERWDTGTGRLISRFTVPGSSGDGPLAFSPDGKTLAVGSGNGTVQLWDTAAGRPIRRAGTPDNSAVSAAAFSPDGTTLATIKGNGPVQLWDTATGQPVMSITIPGDHIVDSMAFGQDGKTLATISDNNGTVRLWDTALARPAGSLTIPGNINVYSVAYSPGGTPLVTISTYNTRGHYSTVELCDTATGQPVSSVAIPGSTILFHAAFSPDGKTLATASSGGTVQLWDTATGQPVRRLTIPRGRTVDSVAFSPDGETLATGFDHGTVQLWNTATGQPVSSLTVPGDESVGSMAFSPDGKTLAAGFDDGTVRLWNIATDKPVSSLSIPGGNSGLDSMAFSPDGKTLAAGGAGTLELWDIVTGQQVSNLTIPADINPYLVAFSPDGKTLAAGSYLDDRVQLRDVAYLTDPVPYLCASAGQSPASAAWAQYAPGVAYRSGCP